MAGRLGIVACDVVRNEFERVLEGRDDVLVRYLEYALHEKPKEMPAAINAAVEGMTAAGAERVALGYGLCSNGTVGVSCRGGLAIPRCHDCISMLLGSPSRYMRLFSENPGTLWVSDGWIRNGGDHLTAYEVRYKPRMGEKKAFKGASMEIANYTRVCLINNGVGDVEALRERARENARFFGKEYVEVEADLGYFRSFVDGPWDEGDFVILGPGEEVSESFFYKSPEAFLSVGGGR